MPLLHEVVGTIDGFSPRAVDERAARFAKLVVAAAAPTTANRAKALLFAASRLGSFAEQIGLELSPEVVLRRSVIERFVLVGCPGWSAATRRTLRTNLRALTEAVVPTGPPAPTLPRERAKLPYSAGEIASYLALADAQPTASRRERASALICLGAGAGLIGADLRSVRGTDVVARSGGVVVEVRGSRSRVVPVLSRFSDRLLESATFAKDCFLIGGVDHNRHNVTTPLTTSLAGGRDLPRIELGRLRATWLVALAELIGLRAFMDAAGITCSQRLGDLVATLQLPSEERSVAVLGARR